MLDDLQERKNSYFIDAENAAEMARLTYQDQLLTRTMGGVLAEQPDLSNIHNVLDIACGPGGWVLDVAHANPRMQVVGIDISQMTIEYARAQTSFQGLNNASFRVMDILKPLDFPDSSFDLINARFITGLMSRTLWPKLVQECMRITRPGGIIRLTEYESTISNSLACEKLYEMLRHAMWMTEQSFSPGGQQVGITPVLGRFLRDAGYINVQRRAHALDSSAGMEEHASQYQNTMVFLKLIQPFLIKMGITTQEEADILYQQALAEMMLNDFSAIMFFLTVWGRKPSL